MKIKNYQKAAQRTSRGDHDRLWAGCLGLIGEGGEIVDVLKKHKFQGMPWDMARDKLLEEVGDVLWYLAEACAGLNRDIAELDARALTIDVGSGTLTRRAVRLVRLACDLHDALIRMEVPEYSSLVAFPRLVRIYRAALDICAALDADIEYVAGRNIRKLKQRYPDGFDEEKSNERYEEDEEE